MGTTAIIASSMDAARTIDTQVTLPMELYQAIAQRAQIHGHSVSGEGDTFEKLLHNLYEAIEGCLSVDIKAVDVG